MRIHGDKVIRRRKNIMAQTDYKKYEPDLQTDFFHVCGYCGKHEMISHKGMEPDHFVPDNIDHSRQCDYTNLVYSCFTCNRKKLGKWPTKDKDKPHDGNIGFVDPATEEFDLHLGRDETGMMVYYTDVGKYMYEKAFKFDIRPTKAIWQASQIYELMQKLKDKISVAPAEEQFKYIEIVRELMELQTYLFSCKE